MAGFSVGGGGGLPQLAPDLNYPATINGTAGYINIGGLDVSSGLTTILDLSGKYEISLIHLTGMTSNESMSFKMTVDGVVIWNAVGFNSSTSFKLFGEVGGLGTPAAIQCNTSVKVEVHIPTDTSIGLNYIARAIV